MRKEYKNPEIRVATFAAENICTTSGVSASVENLTNGKGTTYAVATVSFNDLVSFNN